MIISTNHILAGLMMSIAAVAPASAGLIIIPTFDSTITSDLNAAAIEGTINTAIGTYESMIATPITVNITFNEGGGLGGSSFQLFTVSYSDFYAALQAGSSSADDATAYARLALDGTGSNNPVTNTDTVLIKPANALALGFNLGGGTPASDGAITLNTSITNPGSPGSSRAFNLLPVVEHEIDEILGLGSTLGLGLPPAFANDPSPEDFFRFDVSGNRSFTANGSAKAFFSLNGTNDLAQFDNQNDGGDFGDWQSNPLPNGVQPKVQDAFASPGVNPSLGVELTALDAIGYTLSAPEPSSWVAMAAALLAFLVIRRRQGTLSAR